MGKWEEGMRVRIRSDWKYASLYNGKLTGCEATIQTNRTDLEELGILVDDHYNPRSSTGAFWFPKECLEIIKNTSKNNKENNKMKKVDQYTKNHKFALVGKPDDIERTEYVSYLGEVSQDDLVVVDYHYGNGALSVRKVLQREVDPVMITSVAGDIMGVADCSLYFAEQARQEKVANLKKQMKERAAKFQEEQFFRMIAKEDAEMQAMLDALAGLQIADVG